MTTQRNHNPGRHLAIHNLQCPSSPSTGIDTMRQSPTNHNGNSCAHARGMPGATRADGSVSASMTPVRPRSRSTAPSHVIPTPTHVISCTRPRHSREGGNLPLRPNSRRDGPLPPSTEIDTMRQSPTNHNENSCPRARATAPTHVTSRTLPHHIPHPPTSYPAPSHVISHTLPRHSREGGNPFSRHGLRPQLATYSRTAWSCRPLAGHANKSNETALSVGGDSWHTIS